jgi:hypothetical protein
MVKCSCCLTEVNVNEFIDQGGFCKRCHKEIGKIIKKGGGYEQIRTFWLKQRAEAAKRTVF